MADELSTLGAVLTAVNGTLTAKSADYDVISAALEVAYKSGNATQAILDSKNCHWVSVENDGEEPGITRMANTCIDKTKFKQWLYYKCDTAGAQPVIKKFTGARTD